MSNSWSIIDGLENKIVERNQRIAALEQELVAIKPKRREADIPGDNCDMTPEEADAEWRRWQDRIESELRSVLPEGFDLDVSGNESGDPLDWSADQIDWTLHWMQERIAALEERLRSVLGPYREVVSKTRLETLGEVRKIIKLEQGMVRRAFEDSPQAEIVYVHVNRIAKEVEELIAAVENAEPGEGGAG